MPRKSLCRPFFLVAAALVGPMIMGTGNASGQPLRPVPTAAFTMPEGAEASSVFDTGVLSIEGGAAQYYDLIHDGFGTAAGSDTLKTLPPITLRLVRDGVLVIPENRSVRRTAHEDWEWLAGVGRIWHAAGTEDTVMALPLTLKERNANCLHYGLLTMSHRAGRRSDAFFQITSETCAYLHFDLAAALPATFDVTDVPGDDVARALAAEWARRWPVAPLSELPFAGELGHPDEVAPASVTTLGFVRDGVHYTDDCLTRMGPYPFCREIPLPSYSFAKTLVSAIGLMRLEALYPGAAAARIADYVPACDWGTVTFEDALDMATGRWGSRLYDEDEASAKMRRFFVARTHAEKLDRACGMFPRRTDPGERFVYQTINSYVLGVAMDAYLAARTGEPDADYFADLVVPLYERLGLSVLAMETSRTYDEDAQPFSGWGSIFSRDDLAKLAAFLLRGGTIDGEAELDQTLLAAALQRTPDDRGLEAVIPAQRYRGGLWAWNAGEYLGCRGDAFIPVMSGFGGLTGALLPNGDFYYYVSDGGAFRWARAAAAAHRSRPLCGTGRNAE